MAKTAKMAAKEQKVQTQIPLFATTCQFCQAVQLHQGQTLQVKKTPNLAIFKDFWQIFTNYFNLTLQDPSNQLKVMPNQAVPAVGCLLIQICKVGRFYQVLY